MSSKARTFSIKDPAAYPFAPLDTTVQHGTAKSKLEGIVFDMDGTLCEPQNYMFGEMRSALGITKQTDIIEHIESLSKDEQVQAWKKIEAIEREAMVKQVAQPGLQRLLEYLDSKHIRRAILTRNFNTPVNHFIEKHLPTAVKPFEPVLTRDFKPAKPSPAGIKHIAQGWGIADAAPPNAERKIPLIMVGDSIDDIIAGHDAGAVTVLLASVGKEELIEDSRTDIVIHQLDQLVDVLENGAIS